MIPITPQSIPSDFVEKVRRPGIVFTQQKRSTDAWRPYWTECLPELRKAYGKICAYSSSYLPCGGTVDHYYPKANPEYRDLVYEWSNYRLASLSMNRRKKDYLDVLDPFQIDENWFELSFPSLLTQPNPKLSPSLKKKVSLTIQRLKLNEDAPLFEYRKEFLDDYCLGEISFQYLKSKHPFMGKELEKKGLVKKIKDIWYFSTK